jgi:mannobiose 2-epimerase
MGGMFFMLVSEVRSNLVDLIIPFWKRLRDKENGGYYGFYDYDLNLHKHADKGVILHSRILWFFSNAYEITKDVECLEHARTCYEFIKNRCVDKEYGGVYWSVSFDGIPVDTTKHTYNQAFAIYGLSSYYNASGDTKALRIAYDLFRLIEDKLKDNVSYMEAFLRDLTPTSNEKLSENGLIASKTMNTLLHVLEAYTELYRVDGNEEVRKCLVWILEQFETVLYDPEKRMLEVFFYEDMKTLSDINSYGHDIEASWLIDRAIAVLGNEPSMKNLKEITENLREHIYEVGYDGTSLNNEMIHGTLDTTKVWWVQAEAVVGFLNGYEITNNKKYLDAAINIWNFIKEHIVDKRENSEWFYDLNSERIPISKKEIAGPWKCPYHNGRMCFEIIKRNIQEF